MYLHTYTNFHHSLSVVHDGCILGGGGRDDGGQDLVAGIVLPGLPVVEVGVLQVGGGLLGARRRGGRVVVAARARRRRRPRGLGLLRIMICLGLRQQMDGNYHAGLNMFRR